MIKGKIERKLNEYVQLDWTGDFPLILKFAYDNLNLSYGYLAKLLSVGKSTVHYWLKGKCKPNTSNMKKCLPILYDLIEANIYRLPQISDFSLNHMGPPENNFSFKTILSFGLWR